VTVRRFGAMMLVAALVAGAFAVGLIAWGAARIPRWYFPLVFLACAGVAHLVDRHARKG